MMRFLRRLAPLAAILAVAGCSSGGHKAASHATREHATVANAVAATAPTQCTPASEAMNCVPKTGIVFNLFNLSAISGGASVQTGIDFGWSCPSLRGYSFAAGYLDYFTSKDLSRACVSGYHAQGKKTVVVFESSALRAQDGFGAGATDARAALREALSLGLPASRPIYFAVDFDSTFTSGSILSYFRGVNSVLGVSRTGVYGGLATMQVIRNNGLAKYYWQTAAWSRGVWVSYANIEQYAFPNPAFDLDRALTSDYGQTPFIASPPPSALCYRHRETLSKCSAAKRYVAQTKEQLRVTKWNLWWATNHRALYHCRTAPPFRLTSCRRLYKQIPALTFNVGWLQGQITRTIAAN